MSSLNINVKKRGIGNIIIDAALYIAALTFIYPFVLLFLTSFKKKEDIYNFSNLPDFLYVDNYAKVFGSVNILSAFANTIIICVLTLLFGILFSSMAGYMISRSKEKIFKVVYMMFAAGLIIPAQTNMIMLFKIGVVIHLINTIPYLVIIYVSGLAPFASLIYVGFVKTIPISLEESARIDGCGMYRTFFKIIFPLVLPATGTIIVTTIFWYWNDFQGPLIYLNNMHFETIIMAIFKFQFGKGATDWGPVFALCFISSLPMIMFFLFTQKYLIRGLVIGAVKG